LHPIPVLLLPRRNLERGNQMQRYQVVTDRRATSRTYAVIDTLRADKVKMETNSEQRAREFAEELNKR
jgi:hypothetical protein